MSLEQKDFALIEQIMYKCADDIAVSISRSFARLEERIDAAESRLFSRIAEVEDRVESSRQDSSDLIGEMREEVRELIRLKDF